MGAITPIAAGLGQVAGTLGTINQVVSTVQTLSGHSSAEEDQALALRQLQETQALKLAQSNADAALSREQIALNAAQDDDERRDALKRAVARQRASFGGSGVSANGGSAQAVLLGLFDESQDEQSAREAQDALRLAAVDQDLASQKSLNVLQLTQLQQQQKLDDTISGFGGLF